MRAQTAHFIRPFFSFGAFPLLALLPLAAPAAFAQSSAKTATPSGTRPLILSKHAEAAAFHGDMASAADFSNVTPSGESLHLVVGRSIFVNTRHRLTRVYVTNPAVVESYTSSPNQVVLTAKAPGTSNLIVWDEAGESQAYFVSADMNIDLLRDALKQALPNDNLDVRQSEGRITVSGIVGTDAASDTAMKLAGMYSKDVSNALVVNASAVKQVKLKVRIVEVDRSKITQFAFNFFSQGGNKIVNTTTGQFPSSPTVTPGSGTTASTLTVSDPLNFLLYSSRLNIGATIQDLETMQVLQILAEPTITALSGQKANFLAGGEFPFPVVQGSTGGQTAISIQFRPYGVKLEFTPFVNQDGTIDLKVAPEVSSLDFTNAVTINGYTIPALATRRADTRVVLQSGQSFAISGLLNNTTTDQLAHTPGISNVPIIGQLFKSKNLNHARSELLVIVTPTVVDPLTESILPPDPKPIVPFIDPASYDKTLPKQKHP